MIIYKRINMGYQIIDSIHIGKTEFVIGYNHKKDSPYAIWETLNGNDFHLGQYAKNRSQAEHIFLKRVNEAYERQNNY